VDQYLRLRSRVSNEWGGAGRDDPFYRDNAFACGAGRISGVISATGEIMPCATTDVGVSQRMFAINGEPGA